MKVAQEIKFSQEQAIVLRRYAFETYGHALKGVQAILIHGENIRASLIATLLIFVFESMQGGSEWAATSIQSASKILKYQIEPDPPDIPDERIDVSPQSNDRSGYYVDDEVLKAFVCLDRPAIGLLTRARDTGKSKPWAVTRKWFNSTYEIIFSFSTIDEARYCYERIRFRIFPEDFFETRIQTIEPVPRGPAAPALLLKQMFAETTDSKSTPLLRHELRGWHSAFSLLLKFSRSPEGDHTFIPASSLLIGASALDLPLHMIDALDQTHPIQDSARDAASNVIALSRAQVAHPDFCLGFVVEMGIIVPLWMVIVLCPDLRLKREAVKVLRSMQPKVECIWDSRAVADAGDIVIQDAEYQESVSLL